MNKQLAFKILKLVAFGVVPYSMDALRLYLHKQSGMELPQPQQSQQSQQPATQIIHTEG